MRFHSRDQVQNFGLPDLLTYRQELPKFADKPNMWSKAWQMLPGAASGVRKLTLVNTTDPIHKLMILGGVGIVVRPFGGNRES
jgi:hypothetical protein